MKVVICGSLKTEEEIRHAERIVNGLFPGADVVTPLNEIEQAKPLVEIHLNYVTQIYNADLVVIVPKVVKGEANGGQTISFTFGESTTYELAIARGSFKPIFILSDLSSFCY